MKKTCLWAGVLTLWVGMASAVEEKASFPELGPLPPVPVPADNPLTPEKIRLGKMLFFDPRLSRDGTMACASCHNPGMAFTDHQPRARGKKHKELGRNTLTVLNAAYHSTFFWDGRAKSLEEQALEPILFEDEMDITLGELMARLRSVPGYRRLFREAFGDAGITGANIAKAIASYERTLVSSNSPFDRYMKGDKQALSAAAQRGLGVFKDKGRCVECHNGPLLSDREFHNIGVPLAGPWKGDEGRFMVVAEAQWMRAYKTPTLRNAALTGPYMHNGAFNTLEEVVEFYDRGGDLKDNLDPKIRPLGLTREEKQQLVEFLESLSDPLEVTVPLLP